MIKKNSLTKLQLKMDEYRIKQICDSYLSRKKGAFRAIQAMRINKQSELTAESQLNSQIGRFSAQIVNNLI